MEDMRIHFLAQSVANNVQRVHALLTLASEETYFTFWLEMDVAGMRSDMRAS